MTADQIRHKANASYPRRRYVALSGRSRLIEDPSLQPGPTYMQDFRKTTELQTVTSLAELLVIKRRDTTRGSY
jgi:hypothetical protein